MNPVEKFIPVCLRVFVLEPVLRRNIWWYPFGIILIRHVLLVLLPPLVKVDPEPRNLRKWEMVWLIPSPWLIFYQPTLTRSSPPLAHVAKNEITSKKMVFGIIWTSYSGRGTCGMYGMDIQRNIFRNQYVPLSLVCFEIEKFWWRLPLPNGARIALTNEAGNRCCTEKMLLTPIGPKAILWLISL